MTMRELAALANVSLSTVSKAFRDAPDVSKETKNHIYKIAKANGCYGKFYKGKYSKQIIAVICPELHSDYYAIYLDCLQKIIEEDNGIVLISTDNFSPSAQSELIEYYSYLNVDGMIVFEMSNPLKKGYDIPIVSFGSKMNCRTDAVLFENETALTEAIALLRELGHQNIAFIGETLTRSKEEKFRKVMNLPEHAENIIVSDKRFEEAGIEGAEKLLHIPTKYTAAICAYDNIAFGVIKQLQKHGYRVPQDFSVIGMDNIRSTAYAETTLSTIDNTPKEICAIAWELLKKKMENKYYFSNQKIIVSARLIVRESIGPVPK